MPESPRPRGRFLPLGFALVLAASCSDDAPAPGGARDTGVLPDGAAGGMDAPGPASDVPGTQLDGAETHDDRAAADAPVSGDALDEAGAPGDAARDDAGSAPDPWDTPSCRLVRERVDGRRTPAQRLSAERFVDAYRTAVPRVPIPPDELVALYRPRIELPDATRAAELDAIVRLLLCDPATREAVELEFLGLHEEYRR